MELSEHQLELAWYITETNMPPSGGLCRREPTPPQAKRERGRGGRDPGNHARGNAKKKVAFLRKRTGPAAPKIFQQKEQQRAVQKEGRVCSNPV